MKKLTVILLLMLANSAAQADDFYQVGPDSPTDDEWNYLIAFPMVWAPDISGSITADTERVDIDVPFNDIISNLNFGVIGELYAQKGDWLYSLRINYLRIKSDSNTEGLTGPITGGIISPGHNVETDMHLAVNDFLAGYEVAPGLRLFTGVRHVFSKIDLNIKPLKDEGIININANVPIADEHLFDWLVGATYRYWFTESWGVSVGADTKIYGDNDRDYGFNASALYRFGDLHNVWIGYRYLQIGNDSEVEGVKYEMDFIEKGPQIGWAFSF
ncbi:hypothetical protein [Shewanella fidelis]|uniref:Outer membrane protein beta-barrel domain-containing protein n=1 Tax=Shewanella fidelis TaxID=173509 RepID=A0AAW8NNV6_9GAMM|nr:hypothetical protein [Shewanella fidelis]MDR8524572.1 hypothetical protein [Shewanella fidelis]MDW4812048.1 hypothetical protein [Shewanella fidelis]MDW4817498.1 hypothetical protein [Shewanella fidelis]MDW4821565.1 hypothetical protein [Shewanella fidelis]MDW4822654.1 hypothetical protein [Shewanella fidelis]